MVSFFAINGSPSGKKGVTDMVLRPFVAGLVEGGATPVGASPTSTGGGPGGGPTPDSVQAPDGIRYIRDLDIKPCLSDWSCWTKTPGRCSQKDDMNGLLPLVREADIVVLATPVYVDGMTGPLKTFVDRLVAILEPEIEIRDGRCRHPLLGVDGPARPLDSAQFVLVSVCGFYELENFDPLVEHMRAICKNLGRRYGGALLRPHGSVLPTLLRQPGIPPEMRAAAQDVIDAACGAGRELAEKGALPEESAERVSRPLLEKGFYLDQFNRSWSR